jgi:beta-lactamase regulating signal transducer with metallopeptidase domain
MLYTVMNINRWAQGWLAMMAAVLWQSVLLIAVAAIIGLLLRRSSPVVRYWLWQIVAIKLLLMPFWTLAIPFPAWWHGSPPAQAASASPTDVRSADAMRPKSPGPMPLAERGGSSAEPVPSVSPLREAVAAVGWQSWLLFAWATIVILQIARLAVQRIRLAKLLEKAAPAGAELAGLVAELARHIGLRRAPAALSVAGDCPLFVCGLRKPRLVLPDRLIVSLDDAQRKQVILHELAHIKRRDLAWGWPAEIARMIYFFNPLVYWAAYRLRLERELACDQLAMARSGHPPADYARTLVEVVSHASQPASAQAAAIAAGLEGGEKKDEE